MAWNNALNSLVSAASNIFGENVIVQQQGFADYSSTGIFERKAVETNSNGTSVIAFRSVLGVNLSKLQRYPTNKDKFIVRGVTYQVTNIQDDSSGFLTLILQKV